MKLENKITIQKYPYTDNNNKIVEAETIELESLEVTFTDSPKNKTIFATIEGFPSKVFLYGPGSYETVGDYTKSDLERRLASLLGDNPQEYLQRLIPRTLEADPDGPGTILSGMLSALGIKSTANCSCRRRAITMNVNGPEWCEENMETILSWLEEESKKRKLPFVKIVASAMVHRAIKKSKRLLAKNNG